MRLIDADSLETHEIYEGEWVRVVYADDIDNAPTIEAEPVKRGRWIYLYDGNYKCSVCGEWWTCDETPKESGLLYCPNCGAKMDEVEDDLS